MVGNRAMEKEQPLYLAKFVSVTRAYKQPIIVAVSTVLGLFLLVAAVSFVLTPRETVTSQRVRLDFDGVNRGLYPNGLKFSQADLVSAPVLRDVFERNDLSRFLTYSRFAESMFVLENRGGFERLAADYGSRLADPKLTPVDRERIESEFASKYQSLPKNEYTLNFATRTRIGIVPTAVVRKVLQDTLQVWADHAVHEQDVLRYRVPVLSPEMIQPVKGQEDPRVSLHVLRAEIGDVLDNIARLSALPGAELARTNDGTSLEEVRLRLDSLVRYRIEPLAASLRGADFGDRSEAVIFLEEQIASDQRRLAGIDEYIEGARTAMAMYSGHDRVEVSADRSAVPQSKAVTESVMPQINETFLDKLFALTKSSADADYRQQVVADMRKAVDQRIPIQLNLAYHQHALAELRGASISKEKDGSLINREVQDAFEEARSLVGLVKQIYTRLSGNLNPSTQLYTVMSPALQTTEVGIDLTSLLMLGLGVGILATAMAIAAALLHARIRREESEEVRRMQFDQSVASDPVT